MFKMILKGFWESKNGQFYLSVVIVSIVYTILAGGFKLALSPTLDSIYFLLSIIFLFATIQYAYFLNIAIWKIMILILLIFIPVGSWLTIFYLAGKTYTAEGGTNNVSSKEDGRQEVEDNN